MKAGKSKVKSEYSAIGAFSTIGLSKPAQRALAGKGINTLKQLSRYSEKEILGPHGIGRTAIPVLKQAMKSAGLTFNREKTPVEPNKKGAVTVESYIKALPKEVHNTFTAVRKAILAAAPGAEEKIGYGVPFYRLNGHLCALVNQRFHCSLVTMSYDVIRKFKEELKPYKISGTTVHFTSDNPLSPSLVKKIIKERIAENASKTNAKKKEHTK